ncbi:HK97 family phage prohead protease [Saccharopolyspora sp. NPDC000995]
MNVISGIAIVYNSPTRIATPHGEFDEMISPGAAKDVLASTAARDIAALQDHNPTRLLGRVRAGTLSLEDGPRGLRARITLPDGPTGKDVFEAVQRGDLRGMSFMFTVGKDEWRDGHGGSRTPLRIITKIGRLLEVSAVTFPAYPDTTLYAERSERDRIRQRMDDIEMGFAARLIRPRFGKRIAPPVNLGGYARSQRSTIRTGS